MTRRGAAAEAADAAEEMDRGERQTAEQKMNRELRIVDKEVHVFEYDPVAPPALRQWDGDVECRVLDGHSRCVLSVAFSPDGGLLASGSRDKTVLVRRLPSCEEVARLDAHTDFVESVAFSPNGEFLASGSQETKVCVWRVADLLSCGNTSPWKWCVADHADYVSSVAFSPNNELLASASDDRTIRIYRVSDGERVHVLRGHAHYVTSVAFSPSGTQLASGGFDRRVRIWDAAAGECRRVISGHRSVVRCVVFFSRRPPCCFSE
jgi:WD40 repeat protein